MLKNLGNVKQQLLFYFLTIRISEKWEEERKAREAGQQDLLKQRQKEADLEKQRKLEAFKAQAAQPRDSKHLDEQERRLREKHQQAEILKQRELERYDRMARHEDLSQKSTVTQETSRGNVKIWTPEKFGHPKNSDTRKSCCNYPEISRTWFLS